MKKYAIICVLIVLAVVLTACGAKLPEGIDRTKLEERTADITDCINARDFESIEQWIRKDAIEKGLTAEALELTLSEYLDEFGTFEKVQSTQFTGTSDAETGEEYAAAVIKAKYEKATVEYNYFFDANVELIGLYLR